MTRPTLRWRTVDIVVAAVIAAAFGVVFWYWSSLWTGAANAIPLPGRAFMYGMWLVPGVLGGLIIRKPGAAFFTEAAAAVISAALGTEWGLTLVIQGPIQALFAELAFAIFAYRLFNLGVAALAGALSGLAAGLYDILVWYPADQYSTSAMRLPYVAITAVSAMLVAGVGGWLLIRLLAGTGVLDRFPAGRERTAI